MRIELDAPDLDHLRLALEGLNRRGLPHAGRNALNAAAFEARKEWQRQIADAMILRNKWTERSIRVRKARGINLHTMEATVGSVADYMQIQEGGGTEVKSGRHGVPIPTTVASGEGRNASVRRRLVRRPNRLPNINLAPRISGNRKQRNAATISMARRSGRKHVFLELERTKGLFLLAGGKRKPRVEMVWNLSHPSVRIPGTHTLSKTIRAMRPRTAAIVRKAVIAQIERALARVRR